MGDNRYTNATQAQTNSSESMAHHYWWCIQVYLREIIVAREGERFDAGLALYTRMHRYEYRSPEDNNAPLANLSTSKSRHVDIDTDTDINNRGADGPEESAVLRAFKKWTRIDMKRQLEGVMVSSRRLEGGLVERRTQRHTPARTFE